MSEASGPPTIYRETPQKKAIKELIGQKESQGNYNRLVGGKGTPKEAPLTEMSIGEVLKLQKSMEKNGHISTALGKYQFINKTLKSIVEKNPRDFPLNEPFNEARQELAANILLERRGWEKFASGEMSDKQMATELAKEWASMPVPEDMKGNERDVKAGESFYAGDGKNKSGVSPDAVLKTLNVMPGPSAATTLIDMPEAPLASEAPVGLDPLAAIPQQPPMPPQPMSIIQDKGMMHV